MKTKSFPTVTAALLALAACADQGEETPGELEAATFYYAECAGNCALGTRAIAAGEAHTTIGVRSPKRIATAVTADPTIATVEAPTDALNGDWRIPLLSGRPGTTRLTIRGEDGAEIDHTDLVIAPTTVIGIVKGWQGEPLRVIAGQRYDFHATTLGERGETLVGNGAIKFEFAGVLRRASAPVPFADQESFDAIEPGAGTIALTAIEASRTIDVEAIAAGAVDTMTLDTTSLELPVGGSIIIGYEISAAGVPVYGSVCNWVVRDGALVDLLSAPSFEQKPSGLVFIQAKAKGRTRAECTWSGGTAAVDVNITD
jgi:hypothetical protein